MYFILSPEKDLNARVLKRKMNPRFIIQITIIICIMLLHKEQIYLMEDFTYLEYLNEHFTNGFTLSILLRKYYAKIKIKALQGVM